MYYVCIYVRALHMICISFLATLSASCPFLVKSIELSPARVNTSSHPRRSFDLWIIADKRSSSNSPLLWTRDFVAIGCLW
ncbi:uncharacterized protein F4807DRAFT_442757 [Annulohypoxylon truncatum]|uniref:uncharacterized protein n=1 Tax=Annulohypoxylon truncatum TaxID=327061 RepID=UPI002007AF00|nr:uncharacterized protein F4807DRAFT_442757 [Annulohypoxylon truncatum]KAI1205489.1 hypothetical protein F4807DRAFT_442757 [Annulohypoxylon truncatum]